MDLTDRDGGQKGRKRQRLERKRKVDRDVERRPADKISYNTSDEQRPERDHAGDDSKVDDNLSLYKPQSPSGNDREIVSSMGIAAIALKSLEKQLAKKDKKIDGLQEKLIDVLARAASLDHEPHASLKSLEKELAKKDKKIDSLQEKLIDVSVRASSVDFELKSANFELLRIQGILYPRCVMENFEVRNTLPKQQKHSRYALWEQFAQNGRISRTLRKYGLHPAAVPKIATELYRDLSNKVHHHSFRTGAKVVIDTNSLTSDEFQLMQAIIELYPLHQDDVHVIEKEVRTTDGV